MANARTKRELSDEEIEALDEFLQYEFNHGLYEQLTDEEDPDFELFEPLEFFRIFYKQVELIQANSNRPLSVCRNLRNLGLSDHQYYFLYHNLIRYFDDEVDDDESLKVCCREIRKLQEKLDVDDEYAPDHDSPVVLRPYNFEVVKAHLETLLTIKEKIAYLIQEETRFEQDGPLWHFDSDTRDFGQKCRLEIKKLERLRKLEAPEPPVTVAVGKHKDLTLDRAVLAVNYLLTALKVNTHNTEKAKFISFLTGFSENTVRQKLSNPYDKEGINPASFRKDLKVVRAYFERLGLNGITSLIDKELEL